MVITYNGGAFFKIQFGDTILAFNPISKESKLKPSKFGADVALVCVNHPDCNGIENVNFGEKKAFAITGPGEYEVKEVFIKGFPSESKYGGEQRVNTVYFVTLEGMNLCFLGELDSKELKKEIVEALAEVDILFAPIGGNGTLNASDAYKLAVSLEPKLIIPFGFEEGAKDSLKTFLKEGGEDVKPIDKLTIKRKDLEGKEGDIVILSSSN